MGSSTADDKGHQELSRRGQVMLHAFPKTIGLSPGELEDVGVMGEAVE